MWKWIRCLVLGHQWRKIAATPFKLKWSDRDVGNSMTRITSECARCGKIKQQELDGFFELAEPEKKTQPQLIVFPGGKT